MCVPAQSGWEMVRRRLRRLGWLAACLLASCLVSAGCNPGALGFLLLMQNPNAPPDWYNFTETGKKPNPKVVFLVSHASAKTQANTDLFNADQMLAQRLTQILTKLYKENGDKVQIVSPFKVQDYRAKHLEEWNLLGPEKIGKNFGADFVVNMEITKLRLYASRVLYQGQAEIQISVLDMKNADEGTMYKSYICTFPDNRPVPIDDCGPDVFRANFIDKMAHDLSCWFAAYPSDTKHRVE